MKIWDHVSYTFWKPSYVIVQFKDSIKKKKRNTFDFLMKHYTEPYITGSKSALYNSDFRKILKTFLLQTKT